MKLLRNILIAIIVLGVVATAGYSVLYRYVLSSFEPVAEYEYIQKQKEEEIELAETTPIPHTKAYVEVKDGCGTNYQGSCVNVRSGPSKEFPVVSALRTGVVLRVATTTYSDEVGGKWYRIVFDEWVRYPERVTSQWYVHSDFVTQFEFHVETLTATTTSKRILVDRSDQMMYAYENEQIVFSSAVSTGKELTPTPRGEFEIYYKTPSRYMQGPLPGISEQYYDLPGVPWDMYFTKEGGAFHGAYWHENFGRVWSSGCVNLPLDMARTLYEWAPLGTKVLVRD
jgi:hypothetical protein